MIKYKERWFDGAATALFLCMSLWMIQWETLNNAWSSKADMFPIDLPELVNSDLSKPLLSYLIAPVPEQAPIQPLLPEVNQITIENDTLQASTVPTLAADFLKVNEKALLLQLAQNTIGEQLKNIVQTKVFPRSTTTYQPISKSYMFGPQTIVNSSPAINEVELNASPEQDVLKRERVFEKQGSAQASIFSKEIFNLLKQTRLSESKRQEEMSASSESVEQVREQAFVSEEISSNDKPKTLVNKTEKRQILHDENMDKVKKLIFSNQESLAITQLQNYVEQYPSVLGYRMLLGELYLKNKQYTTLKSLILGAFPDQEKPRELVELLARSYIEQQNLQEALILLDQYHDDIEKAPNMHGLIANIYQRTQQYNKAENIYAQLVQYFPSIGKWWLGLAISLEGQNRVKDAFGAYQKALDDERLPVGLKSYAKERVDYLKPKVKQNS